MKTRLLFLFICFGPIMGKTNLSKVKWAHAVNSKVELANVLKNDSGIDMIEADVNWGYLDTDKDKTTPIAIMSHTELFSDLSLEQFMKDIKDFNAEMANENHQKGFKLDFKTTEVYSKSIKGVKTAVESVPFPVWLNADIILGPKNASGNHVDALTFMKEASTFPKTTVLSIGWKTRYGKDDPAEEIKEASYSQADIDAMLEVIKETPVKQPITFPVRAGIAAESYEIMLTLLQKDPSYTLTVWNSQKTDVVEIQKLRKLIFKIGLDRTYVDVDEDLRKKLDLDQ